MKVLISLSLLFACAAVNRVGAADPYPVISRFAVDLAAEFKQPQDAPPPVRCPSYKLAARSTTDVVLEDWVLLRDFELRYSDGSYRRLTADILFRPKQPTPPGPSFGPTFTPRCPSLKRSPAATPSNQPFLFKIDGVDVARFSDASNLVPNPADTKNLSLLKAIKQFPFTFGEAIETFSLFSAY